MKKLNDKTTGGSAPQSQLSSGNWNNIITELVNLLEATGISLDESDPNQLGKAIANYVASAKTFDDSGSANNYILEASGNFQNPTSYKEGMEIIFRPLNSNTGASKININGLGDVDLKYSEGGILSSGELSNLKITKAIYRVSDSSFRLTNQKGSTLRAGELQLDSTVTNGVTSQAPTSNAVFDAIAVVENNLEDSISNVQNGLNQVTDIAGDWVSCKFSPTAAVANFTTIKLSASGALGKTGWINTSNNTIKPVAGTYTVVASLSIRNLPTGALGGFYITIEGGTILGEASIGGITKVKSGSLHATCQSTVALNGNQAIEFITLGSVTYTMANAFNWLHIKRIA
jgi:hypothetical protein